MGLNGAWRGNENGHDARVSKRKGTLSERKLEGVSKVVRAEIYD